MKISRRHKKKVSQIFLFTGFLILSGIGFPETRYIGSYQLEVSAYKSDLLEQEIGNYLTVITREELDEIGGSYLKEVLEKKLNLNLIDSGGTKTIIMNGHASNQYKIMVNGIELKDPTTPQGTPYLDSLLLTDIRQIEVVEGAMSTLYGTEAMAGIINIITGEKDNMGVRSLFSKDYYDVYLGIGGGIQGLAKLSLSYGQRYSKLLSWQADNEEKDAEQLNNLSVKVTSHPGPLTWEVFHQENKLVSDLDGFNTSVDARQVLHGIQFNVISLLPHLNHQFRLNESEVSRKYDGGSSTYLGRIIEWELLNSYTLAPKQQLHVGVVKRYEDGQSTWFSRETQNMNGGYVLYLFSHPFLSLQLGARQETYSSNKSVNTYSGGASKHFAVTGTTIKLNTSTGYREPALYEKYASGGTGNPNLEAESSQHQELVIKQDIFEFVELELSVFQSVIKKKIDWISTGAWTGQYQNVTSDTKVNGQRAGISLLNIPFFTKLRADYIHSYSRNDMDVTLRNPEYKLTVTARFNLLAVKCAVFYRSIGTYMDTSNVTMPAYQVLDIVFQKEIAPSWDIIVKGVNVLNADYQEVNGYNTLGQTWFVGLKGKIL